MTKYMQNLMNEICTERYQECVDELVSHNGIILCPCPLCRCNARVYETETFFVLESYCTVVAFIDKENDILYDVLRYTYGYTATSALHIRKFNKIYSKDKCGCSDRLVYREI